MKKLLLLVISFISLFAEIKELKTFDELESNKNIFIMFSTDYCPWCIRQTKVLDEISKEKEDWQIVKVKDDSKIYKELLEKYPFVIEFFPTSYIISKKDDELHIKYEFQGYQKKSEILSTMKDEDSF